MIKLPSIVTRGHTYVPCPEGTPARQMRCAGCKHPIKVLEQFVRVQTDFGRHHWHPVCYDRKKRRHLTLPEFDVWCKQNRI